MVSYLKTRLGAMMFLQYVIWGAWYVTLNTYLTSTLKFSGTEAGAVFGTTALASLVAPFLVGLVADRWFATERVLAALYALCGVFLLIATQVTTFGSGLHRPSSRLPVLLPDDRADQLDHDAAGG